MVKAPKDATYEKYRSLWVPRSRGRGVPSTTARAASGTVAGMRRLAAKSLVLPLGRYPTGGRVSSCIRPDSVPLRVPSPPAHTTRSKSPPHWAANRAASPAAWVSATFTRYPAFPKVATASNRGALDLVLPARGLTMNSSVLSMNSLLFLHRPVSGGAHNSSVIITLSPLNCKHLGILTKRSRSHRCKNGCLPLLYRIVD